MKSNKNFILIFAISLGLGSIFSSCILEDNKKMTVLEKEVWAGHNFNYLILQFKVDTIKENELATICINESKEQTTGIAYREVFCFYYLNTEITDISEMRVPGSNMSLKQGKNIQDAVLNKIDSQNPAGKVRLMWEFPDYKLVDRSLKTDSINFR